MESRLEARPCVVEVFSMTLSGLSKSKWKNFSGHPEVGHFPPEFNSVGGTLMSLIEALYRMEHTQPQALQIEAHSTTGHYLRNLSSLQ